MTLVNKSIMLYFALECFGHNTDQRFTNYSLGILPNKLQYTTSGVVVQIKKLTTKCYLTIVTTTILPKITHSNLNLALQGGNESKVHVSTTWAKVRLLLILG